MKLAKDNNVNIYPVDSEHSAIFQSLNGEYPKEVERILLTAGAGWYRGLPISICSSDFCARSGNKRRKPICINRYWFR